MTDARSTVAVVLALAVGIFLCAALLAVYALAQAGHNPEAMFAALFALVSSLVAGLAGWLAKSAPKDQIHKEGP